MILLPSLWLLSLVVIFPVCYFYIQKSFPFPSSLFCIVCPITIYIINILSSHVLILIAIDKINNSFILNKNGYFNAAKLVLLLLGKYYTVRVSGDALVDVYYFIAVQVIFRLITLNLNFKIMNLIISYYLSNLQFITRLRNQSTLSNITKIKRNSITSIQSTNSHKLNSGASSSTSPASNLSTIDPQDEYKYKTPRSNSNDSTNSATSVTLNSFINLSFSTNNQSSKSKITYKNPFESETSPLLSSSHQNSTFFDMEQIHVRFSHYFINPPSPSTTEGEIYYEYKPLFLINLNELYLDGVPIDPYFVIFQKTMLDLGSLFMCSWETLNLLIGVLEFYFVYSLINNDNDKKILIGFTGIVIRFGFMISNLFTGIGNERIILYIWCGFSLFCSLGCWLLF